MRIELWDLRTLALAGSFLPLAAFCAAGVLELRSERSVVQKARCLVPVILGMGAYVLFWTATDLFPLTPDSAYWLSRGMTMFSAAIACSGVFITYSRRGSAVWMACGGLLLTLEWLFYRILD